MGFDISFFTGYSQNREAKVLTTISSTFRRYIAEVINSIWTYNIIAARYPALGQHLPQVVLHW